MMTESSERGENTQRAHWSLQPNNVNKVNENTTYTESYHDMLLARTHTQNVMSSCVMDVDL